MVANKTVSSPKVNSPKALNICIPPYFPSNRTVLFNGLKARHILTKTTSKQPRRKKVMYIYTIIKTFLLHVGQETSKNFKIHTDSSTYTFRNTSRFLPKWKRTMSQIKLLMPLWGMQDKTHFKGTKMEGNNVFFGSMHSALPHHFWLILKLVSNSQVMISGPERSFLAGNCCLLTFRRSLVLGNLARYFSC